jgi:hypothetical protein
MPLREEHHGQVVDRHHALGPPDRVVQQEIRPMKDVDRADQRFEWCRDPELVADPAVESRRQRRPGELDVGIVEGQQRERARGLDRPRADDDTARLTIRARHGPNEVLGIVPDAGALSDQGDAVVCDAHVRSLT